jgi:hypothetical protein
MCAYLLLVSGVSGVKVWCRGESVYMGGRSHDVIVAPAATASSFPSLLTTHEDHQTL